MRRDARLGSADAAVRAALAVAALLPHTVRVHLSIGAAPAARARDDGVDRAPADGDEQRAERRPHLPRYADLARPVPARHRAIRLSGCAAATAWQHVGGGCRILDLGDRSCPLTCAPEAR